MRVAGQRINSNRKILSSLRELIYMLALKKTSLEEKYEILKRYDDRLDIQMPGDHWNIVDRTKCSPDVINQSKAKIEKAIERYVEIMNNE